MLRAIQCGAYHASGGRRVSFAEAATVTAEIAFRLARPDLLPPARPGTRAGFRALTRALQEDGKSLADCTLTLASAQTAD